jgi:hypothetical protein
MYKLLLLSLMCAGSALAQYKLAPAGAPPPDLDPAIIGVLQNEGARIVADNGSPVCEIWLRKTMPSGPKANETGVTLPTIPHGALLGVIRYPGRGADRRGQTLKPGLYMLRFSYYPPDGNHQGAAPQRDFLILSLASADKDPNATPKYDTLMDMSRKASGTPHPAVLSLWKADTDAKPGFVKEGDNDWVLRTNIGDTLVAIILIGQAAG